MRKTRETFANIGKSILYLLPTIALSQTLTLSNNQINANPTQRVNQYTLLESTNLTENSWSPIETQRGTESNLVFTVNRDLPTKFFKTDSSYQPFEPNKIIHIFRRQATGLGTQSFNHKVVNYDSTNVNSIVSWTETFNPTYASYSTNMPFEQTLTPGTNNVTTTFYSIGLGTGQSLEGYISIGVAE